MGEPTWRRGKTVIVPEARGRVWTVGLDYVTPGKLYKITVEPAPQAAAPAVHAADLAANPPQDPPGNPLQTWKLAEIDRCGADGAPKAKRSGDGTVWLDTCAVGALIAKIGGSAADVKPDAANKGILFSVGRHCVFVGPEAAKTGALYLGVNDAAANQSDLDGSISATLWEAL